MSPDISQLVSQPLDTAARRQVLRAVISRAPVDDTDSLEAVVPGFASHLSYEVEPTNWVPRGSTLPTLGALCLLVLDSDGDAWMTSYAGPNDFGSGSVGAGPPGPQGPPGAVLVFEQPNEPPVGQPVGAMWIDTDAVPSTVGSSDLFANVKAAPFNAVGNGIADDANALDAAIADGRPVFLPSGTYLISRKLVLRSGLIMFGCGSVSTIKLQANVAVNIDMLSFSGTAQDIVLSSFVIDGDKANQNAARLTTCVNLTGVTRPKLIDMIIKGGLIEGAYLYQCPEAKIVRTNASGNGNYRADASGIHLDTCERAYLGGNVTDSNGFHGLIFTGVVDSVVDGHWSRSNGFDGARVQYSSSRNRISKLISDSNFRGIYFTTDSTLNHVDQSSMLNAEASGLVFNNAYNNQFAFVHVQNCDYAVQTVVAADINQGYGNTWRANRTGIYSLVAGSAFNAIAAGAGNAI
jgi:hypothetical protein